ncbi:MFS general substrate transporter, partial [Thozetella sp. PMI_491]
MAFTNLAVFGGAFFTPILVGKITHEIHWWWTFYLVAILSAVCLPFLFFFCPETAYRRDKSLNLDLLDTDGPVGPRSANATRPSESAETEPEKENGVPDAPAGARAEANESPSPKPIPEKHTFVQSLALFPPRQSDEFFLKLLLRPLPLMLFQPAFLWACLIQGLMIGWTVFIGVILAQFLIGYPLWWDEVKTGYTYTAAFVGAVVGFIIAGLLADWSARWLTKKNNGVYEPEFRIVLVIPQFIIGVMGIFGWGITVDMLKRNQVPYQVPLFFFGCEVAGMVIGAVGSSLYIVDAYRDLAIEGFTSMLIFKNFFSFALTWEAFNWLVETSSKTEPVFNAVGALQVVVCFTSIPLYIYGKRIRSFYHRHDLLAFFKL